MPLELAHSGMYICTATNAYGSTSKFVTLDGNSTVLSLVFALNKCIFAVQPVAQDISIVVEPGKIFPIDSDVRLTCKLPQAHSIFWSIPSPRRREPNPLQWRMTANEINKRFVCQAKDLNGKWHRKAIRVQRYSDEQLIVVNNDREVERSFTPGQRISTRRFSWR